ncbi:MAG: cell division protein FtsZ [Rhodospirillaceae bacterium]|nr:cell division protein FtsZ [Rhodospirillaceae bacterium]
MTINFTTPEADDHLKPRITVVGCGGAGGNAVNNMISKQLEGVEFVVANTDAQALAQSLADRRVQLGRAITHGLGAGSRPDMGRAAAEEAMEDIGQILNGSHMVFIAAGMGGGTGTGAAPVIARLAREQGMLTVGVVTKPFQFEGSNRMRIADAGIEEMQQFVDTLIVIPNQNLFRIANEKTTFADAFAMADDVLHSGVRGVTDLMVVPGLINLDFADIRSVMSEMGKAMMGTGEADGEERARLAAEAAISNPLLDDVSMKGARGVLINITGGPDMTLFEVDEAANRIGEEVDADANIIFGSALDDSLEGRIRVSVVATGIDIDAAAHPRPVLKVYSDPVASKPAASSEPEPIPMATTTMDIPTNAPAATAMTAGNTATALKLPDPMPEIETSPVQKGEVEPEKVSPQTDIVALVEETSEENTAKDVSSKAIESNNDPAATDVADETFIPPQPAEPAKASPAKTIAAADPFREAELLNASPAPEKKRSPSIFQRMTGTSWPKKDEPEAKKEPTAGTMPPLQSAKPAETSPKMEAKPAEPVAEVSEAPVEAVAPSTKPAPEPEAEAEQPAVETASLETPSVEAPEAKTEEITPEPPKVPTPAPVTEPAATASPDNESQPKLRGVEPQERLPNSQSEEDLLEIPAFLRRQAN